jgi:hypothetical protein
VRRKAEDHGKMKMAMSKAMVGAQRKAERKIYTRTSVVSLPSFLMEKSNAA